MRSLLCLFPWKVYIFQLLDHSPVQVNLLLSDFRLPSGVCLQGHSWNLATFYFQHAALSWKEMIILFKWLRWVWPSRALLQIRSLQLVVHLKDAKWMWDFLFFSNIVLLIELLRGGQTSTQWSEEQRLVEETQPTRSHVFHPLISSGELANKRNTWRDRLLTHHSENVL